MTGNEWESWLETVADADVDGFEEKAHKWAERFAKKSSDITAESCLKSFFGDNPHDWLGEAYENITTNCKTKEVAGDLLKGLYEDVMAELQPIGS